MCQFNKTIGRKWNMRHRFAADILAKCENKPVYKVSTKRLFRGEELVETFNVCGVHKNVIKRRAELFEWEIKILPIQGDPTLP